MKKRTKIMAALLALVMLVGTIVPAMSLSLSAQEATPLSSSAGPDPVLAIDTYIEQFVYYDNNGKAYLYNQLENGFWTDAEIIEVVIDAYEILGDVKYLEVAKALYDGFIARRGKGWMGNSFNDDIFWMTLATSRLYLNMLECPEIDKTDMPDMYRVLKDNFDKCYNRAWDTTFMGGGFWWTTDNASKNGCVDGPGAFSALMLYKITNDEKYLNIAIEVMDWEIANLFNEQTGQHYDSVYVDGRPMNTWTNTGNQGNIIGPCTILYEITGEEKYLNYAKKAADHAATLGDGNLELLNEGANSGDTIGGKGQLGRWMGYFVRATGDDDYNKFMTDNANSAWNMRNSDNLMWGEFGRKTVEDIKNTDKKMANTDLNMKDYAAWGCSAAVTWLLNTPGLVESEEDDAPVEDPSDDLTTTPADTAPTTTAAPVDDAGDNDTADSSNSTTTVIIVAVIVAVVLVAGGITIVIVMKKKKSA